MRLRSLVTGLAGALDVTGTCATSDQALRGRGSPVGRSRVGSALLYAESRWNRIRGSHHMPVLVNALEAAYRLRCSTREVLLP